MPITPSTAPTAITRTCRFCQRTALYVPPTAAQPCVHCDWPLGRRGTGPKHPQLPPAPLLSLRAARILHVVPELNSAGGLSALRRYLARVPA